MCGGDAAFCQITLTACFVTMWQIKLAVHQLLAHENIIYRISYRIVSYRTDLGCEIARSTRTGQTSTGEGGARGVRVCRRDERQLRR